MQELKEKISKMSGTDHSDTNIYEDVDDALDGLDNNQNHYCRHRNTLTKKLSTISRSTLKKRESMR